MEKYPEIKVDLDEDLNIERATIEIVKKCWYNKRKFPSATSIADITQTSIRNIYRIVKDHDLGDRNSQHYGIIEKKQLV